MPHSSPFKRFCRVLAVLVIGQLLFLQAMAASADLHHRCHDHADDPSHECVVTLIQNGGYQCELPDIVPVEISSEPPRLLAVVLPSTDAVLPHWMGGVLANAPPRGP
jgi:hypothetical protein